MAETADRGAILARAGAIFAESLDLETTLRSVARLCAGPLADYCIIDLVDDGRLVRAAAESVSELDFSVARLEPFVPSPEARAHPITRAWREGRTCYLPELSAPIIDEIALSAEHRQIIGTAHARAVLCVPISAHGRILGVLSLGISGAGRRTFDAADIAEIEELARDAGTAIANAQLYRELAQSEARYRRIIETTREGVMILDPGGFVQYANPQFAKMLGYAIDELYGMHFRELFHPSDRAAADERFVERKAGDVGVVECRFVHRDGSDVWSLAAANPVTDETGLVATLSMHTDITERKAMETLLARIADDYRSLAEATPQVVWTADPSGAFDYVNARWVAYSGIPHDRSLAWGWTAAIHPDDLAGALAAWRASRASGSDVDLTVRLRRADGMYRWHLGRARALVRDGEIVRWFGTFTDIHEQRTKERQLALIAQTTELLADTLDREHLIERLCRFLVSELATFVIIDLFDERGDLVTAGTAHRDPALARRLRALHGRSTTRPESARLAAERFSALQAAASESTASLDELLAHTRPEYQALVREAAGGPFICAPVTGRGHAIGLLGIFGAPGTSFEAGDAVVFTEIAARFALALQNAELFAREQHVATTLQKALLPQSLPAYPGVRLDAVYTPGTTEAQIGGDWYDAYPLADGRLAVTVGDVTGRGLQAATIMGRVRQSLEALATYQSDPAELLNAVDAVLRRAHPDAIVTALVGVIDLRRRTFAYATAGHPTPFVRSGADGTVVALPGYGLPLGLRDGAQPPTSTIVLPPNATILLYTDGLVESTRNIDEGERRVRAAFCHPATVEADHPAQTIRDAVLFDGSADDVAVFTITIADALGEPLRSPADSTLRTDWSMHWAFDARHARVARDVRELFIAYLRAKGSGDADYAAAELVFGELIGNVARHAPGLVEVEVEWRGNAPVLHVLDRGPGYERNETLPPSESETGRGLFLISKLTREFTVTRLPGYGSHARAVLPIERNEFAGTGTTAAAS